MPPAGRCGLRTGIGRAGCHPQASAATRYRDETGCGCRRRPVRPAATGMRTSSMPAQASPPTATGIGQTQDATTKATKAKRKKR